METESFQNTGGDIYYGMHFYPGVCAYPELKKTVLINENTIRQMDKTFAGKPVYAFMHAPDVPDNLEEVRKEADGWVVESFYNEADGKHWAKFIVVSERGKKAIRNGYRLSNSYDAQLNGMNGEWNAVRYDAEVIAGEYEHLALVDTPRYDESVVMTPDEFKAYNAKLKEELIKIANSKEKETPSMSKLKFWNRKAAENSADLEALIVTLPKSGKELSIVQLVNAMDEVMEKKVENMADPEMKVKLHDGTMCNVNELLEKHKALSNELAGIKAKNEEMSTETDLEPEEVPLDVEGDLHNEKDEDAEGDDKKKDKDKMDNEDPKDPKDAKDGKLANSKAVVAKKRKEHFENLRNAHLSAAATATPKIEMMKDGIARGKARYGA